jgi:hypothetical protein
MFMSLLKPFKEGGFVYMLYYPLLVTRMFFTILLYFVLDNGIAHSLISIFFAIPMIGYLITFRPFRSIFTLIVALVVEIVLFVNYFF